MVFQWLGSTVPISHIFQLAQDSPFFALLFWGLHEKKYKKMTAPFFVCPSVSYRNSLPRMDQVHVRSAYSPLDKDDRQKSDYGLDINNRKTQSESYSRIYKIQMPAVSKSVSKCLRLCLSKCLMSESKINGMYISRSFRERLQRRIRKKMRTLKS